MKQTGIAILAVLVLVAGAFALAVMQGSSVGVNHAEARCSGDTRECLPDVPMVDTTGKTWTADDLAGKVVMVNYWATWCAPCIQEIPLLTRAYERYRDQGFVLLAVMTDAVTDDQLAFFAKRNGLHYPVVRATTAITDAFGAPEGLPKTFIYGRDGALDTSHLGPLSQGQIDARVPALLASK